MKNIFLLILIFSMTVKADSTDPYYNSIAEMVEQEGNQQLELVYRNESSEAQINDSWYFNLIRLRITALIGLSVPLFASFDLGPRIEFRWKRKNPQGWEEYKIK